VGREGAVDVVEVPAVGAAEVVAGVIAVEVAVAGADNAVVPAVAPALSQGLGGETDAMENEEDSVPHEA
jgi:hypothetical protein